MKPYHISVLTAEVIEGLHVVRGNRYIDATLGGGGHFLEMVRRGGTVLGIDADGDAIDFACKRMRQEATDTVEGKEWFIVKGNFRNIGQLAQSKGFSGVSGILMDLGVSSFQLDSPQKGFSFRFRDAPLDMRFDRESGKPASWYVNKSSEEELYEIFTKFGEEERARAIAHALVRARSVKSLQTAGDLVEVIAGVGGGTNVNKDTLSRIFQALRIATNEEIQVIEEALFASTSLLQKGGRIAVISFHSLEDRVVKRFMRAQGWREISKKPIRPTRGEIENNRRARSAKLRIAEKI